LTVDIADFVGPRPTINFKAVEQTTTPVRAYILGHDNDFRTTPQQVTNLIAGVNRIYEQAGMRFVLESAVCLNTSDSWLNLILDTPDADKPKRDAICDICQHANVIELYFVHSIDQGAMALNNYNAQNQVTGIILSPAATITTLAHEIGHSCGLADIYVMDNVHEHSHSDQLQPVSGSISSQRLPNDWGATHPECHFYFPFVDQPALIRKLLMFGRSSEFKGDIPAGDIYGIWYIEPPDGNSAVKSLAPVSLGLHTTRTPVHQ
ncbi:MAG: hypothetical protein IJS15_15890, partial [Victivallales bacterium]|nr:hypothetical protein [Victivallales bacterium]